MATMNKPASQEDNWYQAVTDNWTAIESSLVDKSLLTTKGDLIGASGPATPTRVAVGSDGQFLTADSSQGVGFKWAAASAIKSQDFINILWGKKFFKDEGFLPSTKLFEYIGTPPAFAGTAGTGTWTREPGAVRSVTGSGIGWYDLGAQKAKVLIVVGKLINGNPAVMLSSTAPTGLNPDGYSMWNDSSLWKRNAGAWTRLDSSTGFGNNDYKAGYALYYDDATDSLKLFLRFGSQWLLAATGTDSTFSTMRYISFQSAVPNQRWATPFACYTD